MIEDILSEARNKMKATLHALETDLNGIRGNRASPSLVDRLIVEYYGQDTELRQLATIGTPEPMQLLIRPFDKGAIKAIEKAIQQADLGINPSVEGDSIRMIMPQMTKERRQQLVKVLMARLEDARVAARNIRRHANDDLKEFEKEGMISEDDLERGEKEVQKLTDHTVHEIDTLGSNKEKDIMQV
jgi:ribosome recycling factor